MLSYTIELKERSGQAAHQPGGSRRHGGRGVEGLDLR
jgi:hypothetical protein